MSYRPDDFRVSGRNFLHVFYLGFEHSILSRLAFILKPTVVPVMWNILDSVWRNRRSFRGAEIHHAADKYLLVLIPPAGQDIDRDLAGELRNVL